MVVLYPMCFGTKRDLCLMKNGPVIAKFYPWAASSTILSPGPHTFQLSRVKHSRHDDTRSIIGGTPLSYQGNPSEGVPSTTHRPTTHHCHRLWLLSKSPAAAAVHRVWGDGEAMQETGARADTTLINLFPWLLVFQTGVEESHGEYTAMSCWMHAGRFLSNVVSPSCAPRPWHGGYHGDIQ
jgi:hypothetical protein